MAKGRKTAAILGAGALAARLGRVELNEVPKPTKLEIGTRLSEHRVPSEGEFRAARQKVFETEPGLRNALRTEDYEPILSGTGLYWKTGAARSGGMKSGGKVTASRRADGIAQRGKTRGKMV